MKTQTVRKRNRREQNKHKDGFLCLLELAEVEDAGSEDKPSLKSLQEGKQMQLH